MGSRYGGIKQMAPVGDGGEYVLDYAIYDAIRSGFTKIVLVVREDILAPIREHFRPAEKQVEFAYVCQRADDLPAPFTLPAGRTKPWGTGHAIRAAREVIDTPFAAINSDDFYGRDSFRLLGEYLTGPECRQCQWAMVAFHLANTLSEHGSVNRGVCTVQNGCLESIRELEGIRRGPDGIEYPGEDGGAVRLTGREPVSLNFWGFTPDLFPCLEELFVEYLKAHGQESRSEFYIPTVVDRLIREKVATAKVLKTPDRWIGMTYPEDLPQVKAEISRLTAQGLYPKRLWE
ncbi:MAG: hypothetical protein IJJ33_03895 [Victivallales bacterium]|nr:hypothetical protein [Victivallales bacterium]